MGRILFQEFSFFFINSLDKITEQVYNICGKRKKDMRIYKSGRVRMNKDERGCCLLLFILICIGFYKLGVYIFSFISEYVNQL